MSKYKKKISFEIIKIKILYSVSILGGWCVKYFSTNYIIYFFTQNLKEKDYRFIRKPIHRIVKSSSYLCLPIYTSYTHFVAT